MKFLRYFLLPALICTLPNCDKPKDLSKSNPNKPDGGPAVDGGTTTPNDGAVDTSSTSPQPGTDTAQWTSTVVDSYTQVERADIGNVPFNPDTVLEYHITMDPAQYEEMVDYGNDEIYRMASLQVRGANVNEDFATIGIRYKGDYSLHHCWNDHGGRRSHSGECAKLSIKLKFSEYDLEGRYFGVKRINLHAMSEDETKLRERLTYDMFNQFGIITARTAHAQLYINDEEPMLVLAIEQIDGRFTAHRYPAGGDGNLYKETWPSDVVTEADLLPQLRTNNNPEDNPDVSRFLEFGAVVSEATEATFESDLAAFVDLNQLLRFMAVDRATKNWDGITAFYWQHRPHNLFWYHDIEQSNLFHIIPWDHDKTMWEYDPYMDLEDHTAEDYPVPDWNVLPLSCDPIEVWYGSVYVFPPGCDNFINLLAATGWDDFVVYGNELLASAMQYDVMNQKVTQWAQQIAPIVDADPYLNPSTWERHVENFREILQKSIGEFEDHLTEGYIIEQ